MIALARGMNLWGMLGVIGLFAFFHGVAHGSELPTDQGLLAMLGMVITTSALHLAGIGIGHFVLRQRKLLQQAVGAVITLLGGYLVMQTL
jgi:urease accessory protein